MTKFLSAAALVALMSAAAIPAQAIDVPQETAHAGYRETGAEKDWIAIYTPSAGEAAMRVCALYSRPVVSTVFDGGEEVTTVRGELAAFINWNEAEPNGEGGEISFILGAPVTPGDVEGHTLTIDGEDVFQMVGDEDRLYVMPEDDVDVLALVRKGKEMTVSAVLSDGRVARDSYSLMGVVATTRIAAETCE